MMEWGCLLSREVRKFTARQLQKTLTRLSPRMPHSLISASHVALNQGVCSRVFINGMIFLASAKAKRSIKNAIPLRCRVSCNMRNSNTRAFARWNIGDGS